ncbi:aldose 1-epimerase family protein [Citricoccus sp.]|uniref:aldose 1-epimerase family protein n=1 Tax=Citricoccus sp. TaxID=1978372 RepID=UPI0028BEE096|nr:aldose 1-epimerase family protein [Citricoccus sp.]
MNASENRPAGLPAVPSRQSSHEPSGQAAGLPFGDPAVTGTQYVLRHGGAEAIITSLAGALRRYEADGTAWVETYGADEVPPSACGIQLSPWPNRVRDGRWTLDGATQQLDLTEPSRSNASHGLLRNTAFVPAEQTDRRVVLRGEIHPQHGYPFRLTHQVTYTLADDGALTVHQQLTNHSDRPAPAAFGAHPFLRIGDVPSEDLVLTLPAATRVLSDDQFIPTGTAPVHGTAEDFRDGRQVGTELLDAAFTDLEPGDDGRHHHALSAPDGRSVELWTDPAFGYVHVFFTDRFPGRPRAVAVEPMTAPANALNSGDGLVWIGPGVRMGAAWGLSHHRPLHRPSHPSHDRPHAEEAVR